MNDIQYLLRQTLLSGFIIISFGYLFYDGIKNHNRIHFNNNNNINYEIQDDNLSVINEEIDEETDIEFNDDYDY
jgi:hypothetical protein